MIHLTTTVEITATSLYRDEALGIVGATIRVNEKELGEVALQGEPLDVWGPNPYSGCAIDTWCSKGVWYFLSDYVKANQRAGAIHAIVRAVRELAQAESDCSE